MIVINAFKRGISQRLYHERQLIPLTHLTACIFISHGDIFICLNCRTLSYTKNAQLFTPIDSGMASSVLPF